MDNPTIYGSNNTLRFRNLNIYHRIDVKQQMTELCKIMAKHGSDKAPPEKHNYTKMYDVIFRPIRNRDEPQRVFELGLGTKSPYLLSNMSMMPESYQPGASLRGWKEYFPKAQIFGADIDETILFKEDRIHTFYCDQTKPEVVQALWRHPKLKEPMDIIVDDGLHEWNANITFFENSIHKTKKFYIIEDINEEYIPTYNQKIEEWFWKGLYKECTFWLHQCSYEIPDGVILLVEKDRDVTSREFYKVLHKHWNHVEKLAELMDQSIHEWKGCGSYMIDGQSTTYQPSFYDKQELLWENTLNKTNVLEIGVHGCHSILIMLVANPKLCITAVDPCYFSHTEKCVQYLQHEFPESIITLIKTKGQDYLPNCKKRQFDLVHLDGDHDYIPFKEEFEYITNHVNPSVLVMDDYDNPNIYKVLKEKNIHPNVISSYPFRNAIIK